MTDDDLFTGTAFAPARVVNVKSDRHTIYCGRAMPQQGFAIASPWANPFRLKRGHTDAERATAIRQYEALLLDNPVMILRLRELRGQRLGCWCAPLACHCDVLARLANGSSRNLLELHLRARRSFGRFSQDKPGEAEWLGWLQGLGALPPELKSWRQLEEEQAAPALEFLWQAHEPVFASPLVTLRPLG